MTNTNEIRKEILDIITHKPPDTEYFGVDLSLYESDVDQIMQLLAKHEEEKLQQIQNWKNGEVSTISEIEKRSPGERILDVSLGRQYELSRLQELLNNLTQKENAGNSDIAE